MHRTCTRLRGRVGWRERRRERARSRREEEDGKDTIHASATSCQYQWGWVPQVNKFEQVSSDGHQMSDVGVSGSPMSDVWWTGTWGGVVQ